MVDDTYQTTVPHVYAIGDSRRGPGTVVMGIADAAVVAKAICNADFEGKVGTNVAPNYDMVVAKRGILCADVDNCDNLRCLGCATVCETCTTVCPNRANVAIRVPGMRQRQILHVDGMCNECGNCAVFCPYDSAPYRDKFTLFFDKDGFDESVNNSGFLPLGGMKVLVRLEGKVFEADLNAKNDLPADIETLIYTVLTQYTYLLG